MNRRGWMWVAAGLALSIGGCNGPSVEMPNVGLLPAFEDAGVEDTPVEVLSVEIEVTEIQTPYPVATLRGEAPGARRIVIQGAGNPLSIAVHPNGSFCVDVPLPEVADYRFFLYAQNMAGDLSLEPTTAIIRYATTYPAIADALTCGGAHPSACSGATEVCGNGRDDDCDGKIDGYDQECISCLDDAFEPNDTADSPRIEPGLHDDLVMCAEDNADYFRIYAIDGDKLTIGLYFDHSYNDLQLELRAVEHEGPSVQTQYPLLAESKSDTHDESIEYEVERAGEYLVYVYSELGANDSSYSLNVRVE